MEMKFTTANFEEEVLKSEIPVLVDFYADWCGPCQMMAPVIGQLAGEYEGRVKIGKLNVDENPDIAVQYKVMSIPTMIIFRNGEVFSKEVGASSKKEVEPIYIPGRFRTASRPSSTWISDASYSLAASTAVDCRISLSAM